MDHKKINNHNIVSNNNNNTNNQNINNFELVNTGYMADAQVKGGHFEHFSNNFHHHNLSPNHHYNLNFGNSFHTNNHHNNSFNHQISPFHDHLISPPYLHTNSSHLHQNINSLHHHINSSHHTKTMLSDHKFMGSPTHHYTHPYISDNSNRFVYGGEGSGVFYGKLSPHSSPKFDDVRDGRSNLQNKNTHNNENSIPNLDEDNGSYYSAKLYNEELHYGNNHKDHLKNDIDGNNNNKNRSKINNKNNEKKQNDDGERSRDVVENLYENTSNFSKTYNKKSPIMAAKYEDGNNNNRNNIINNTTNNTNNNNNNNDNNKNDKVNKTYIYNIQKSSDSFGNDQKNNNNKNKKKINNNFDNNNLINIIKNSINKNSGNNNTNFTDNSNNYGNKKMKNTNNCISNNNVNAFNYEDNEDNDNVKVSDKEVWKRIKNRNIDIWNVKNDEINGVVSDNIMKEVIKSTLHPLALNSKNTQTGWCFYNYEFNIKQLRKTWLSINLFLIFQMILE